MSQQLIRVVCTAAYEPKSWWDIASTIATVCAVLVALGVPFLLDWLQRSRAAAAARAALKAQASEVVYAASKALESFENAVKYILET